MSSMKQTVKNAPAIRWGSIVKDLLILLYFSGMLTTVSIIIQKSFTSVNPSQELVSIIQKGKLEKNGTDPVFEEALRNYTSSSLSINKSDINGSDFSGRTPLMWASYTHYNNPLLAHESDEKRLYYVKKMLSLPTIDVHLTDREGWTALHWASWSGLPKTLEALLDAGARVNQPEGNGYTPLMLAAMRGNNQAVAILLTRGADSTLKNKLGKTALDLAVEDGVAYSKNNSWLFQKTYSAARAVSFSEARDELSNHRQEGSEQSPVACEESLPSEDKRD